MIGKRDIFVKQIKEHVGDLKKPLYKNIDEEFRKMLIQVKVSMCLKIIIITHMLCCRPLKWPTAIWRNITSP